MSKARQIGTTRDARPNPQAVLVSIDRYVCLQSIVHASRKGDTSRLKGLYKELSRLETRDFIGSW